MLLLAHERVWEKNDFFNSLYLIEKILIQEKIPWNCGIDVDENDFSSGHSYLKGEEGDLPDVFRYYKLHGSFNWHFCWRCQNIRISDLRDFGTSGETFSKTDRFTQLCDKCAHNSGQAVLQPLLSHLLQLNIIISQFFRTLVYFHQDHPTSRKNYPYRMFCPRWWYNVDSGTIQFVSKES